MKPSRLTIRIETNLDEFGTKIDNVKSACENLKLAIKELEDFEITLTPKRNKIFNEEEQNETD